MPAFFNGVYGHKASPHYISNRGQHPGARASANHYMATGPISRFVEDIIPLCKVAAEGGFGMDINEFPPCSPLDQIVDLRQIAAAGGAAPRRLRVYAIEDFGIPGIHVSESERRAVHKAAEALRTHYMADVTYINVRDTARCTGGALPDVFKPFAKILSMWASALTSDPTEAKFCDLMAEGHPVDPAVGYARVNWFQELFRWMGGRSRHTLPAITLCIMETLELLLPSWMTISKMGIIIPFKEQLETLLHEDGILLCPTFPAPAPRHHYCFWNPLQFQYTAAFNVLRLPATAVPVWLTADEARPEADPIRYSSHQHHHQHHHHHHNHNHHHHHHHTREEEPRSVLEREDRAVTIEDERRFDLPPDFHLPKGIQIVSASFQDELCVSTAVALRELLGGYRYPPWAQLEGVDY
ncbi:fatty-acid amide hydrolase [Strigomonas culicis]|nr:fatty-acid amide hydrolase [Strigomonas culicis]|eukprot:EPY31321.1 fatty-acid amide hydrolase [Strigomonas culicis]